VDDATQRVLGEAVDVLRTVGASIVDLQFPDVKQTVTDWVSNCAVEAAVAHEATYPARKGEYGPVLASDIERGRALSGLDYQKILLRRLELRGRIAFLFETVDLLLIPVHPFPPLTLAMIRTLGEQPGLIAGLQEYTCAFDMTGHPTITLPGGFFRNRIADRVPACGRQSRRSHAGARWRGIPEGHILASPSSFSHVMEPALSVQSASPNPRIFYGWFVVAAAFAVTFVGFGCAYTFSAFVESLQRDFGASRGSVSLVFSLAGFLYFGLGIVSGPLADRFGSRRLAVAGMILTGLGLAAASAARSLPEVYAAYGLGVGLGVGCAYVPAIGAVQRWFVRRRGFASGLAVSGIGVGTLVMPPLASFFIKTLGWRGAYFALGVLATVLGGGLALLIENDPRGRGLGPDGDPPQSSAQAAGPQGASVSDAIRSRRFIRLYAACLICSFGVFVPFVHLVPYAGDHGVAPASAVLLLGVIGIGSTAGRFFLGGLADRIGRQLSLLLMFAGMAFALAVWAVSADLWSLAAFAFVYGVFYGGWVAILPAVVMDHFGGRNVSGIIGILYTSVAFGTLIGPSAAGFAFDLSHSYTLPILASAGANILAAIIVATSEATAPASKTAGPA
jgi:MFS family permease